MKNLSHLRSAIYGQPLMITESGLDLVCSVFESKIAETNLGDDFVKAAGMPGPQSVSKKYEVRNGVAIIPVMGPLFPRANLMTQISGATSYQGISALIYDAISRMDVSAVCLYADSPGGSVVGCFECATDIYEARKTSPMPIVGLVEGQGCSAAYALLSQCDILFCTEGSVVGSIGVISRMDNFDRAQRNEGNDVTVLRSTELKAPGVGAMTPNQMGSLQKQLMKFDAMFDETVKRGRPGIDLEKTSTGETFVGIDSVEIGLCDELATLEEIVARYGV